MRILGGVARKGSRLVLIAPLLAAIVFISATFPRRTIEELRYEADTIIRGTVEEVRQNPPTGGSLETTIVLSVHEQWKGPRLARLKIHLPGGRRGSLTESVPGVPAFRPGDDVILFLERGEQGTYQILHGRQGKLSVRYDRSSGKSEVQDANGETFELSELRHALDEPPIAQPSPTQ